MDIDKRIGDLEESPIYAMSLGSKELFHSNFWAWLMRRNPEFINAFFPEFESKKPSVEREEKHRDITIHTEKDSKNDEIYIIENKIKSLPYVEQLAKYQIEAGDAFAGGVVAALKDPNFDCNAEYTVTVNKINYNVKVSEKYENGHEYFFEIEKTPSKTSWKFMDYSDVEERIRLKIGCLNDKDKTVTEMYCETVENLCQIVSKKLDKITSQQAKWKFDDAKDLEGIKFDDVYKKLKLDILKEQILKNLKDSYVDRRKINNDDFIFRVETAYSNKQPAISFKFVYNNTQSDKVTDIYSFGIQIQNGGIRRYAETKVGRMKDFSGGRNGYDGFFDAFANCNWFDKDFKKDEKKLKLWFCNNKTRSLQTNMSPQKDEKKTKDSTQYNAYTDFVYQYYNIPDESTLVDEIKDNLQYAESICEEAKSIFENFPEE